MPCAMCHVPGHAVCLQLLGQAGGHGHLGPGQSGGSGKGGAGLSQSQAGCLFKCWRGARRGLFICRECWLPAPRRRKRIQRNKAGPPGKALGRGRDGHGPARPPRTQLVAPTGGRTPVLPTHTSTQWEAPMGRPTVLSPLGWAPISGWLGVTFPPAQGAPVSVEFPQALPGHGAGRQLSIRLGTALARCPHTALQGPSSAVWGAPHGPPGQAVAPELCWPGGARGGRRGKNCLCLPVPSACWAPRQPCRGPITQPAQAPPHNPSQGPSEANTAGLVIVHPSDPPTQCSPRPAVARRVQGW